MDWQQLVSLIIVGATAMGMLWIRLRRRKSVFERATACSGCAVNHQVPRHSVVFHARKGERPQVIVTLK